MKRWRWLLSQFVRKLWFRVTVMALIGVATAAAGIFFPLYVPDAWTIRIGAQAIDGILNLLASSLLAVTVFSLSTMVAAYSAATNNVTPRATKLLMEDNTSQNVLGTFIGAFLFSLVGIVALSTGLYGTQGRAILLVVTIGLIALIAATILRWIDYLARFGRLGETIDRVERATWGAMETRLAHPHFGGRPMEGRTFPEGAIAVFSDAIGYIQHVDVAALEAQAKEAGVQVYVTALPGAFADPSRPVALVTGPDSEDMRSAISSAFTIAPERTFEQDPRFGLCVLSEIASRALSPAVNDPGTAIDVIGRAVRLLAKWSRFEASDTDPEVARPHVWVPAITAGDMFDDVFAPIARDGSGLLEIQIRLQKAFVALVATDRAMFGDAARRHSARALKWARSALTLEDDLRAVELAAAQIGSVSTQNPGSAGLDINSVGQRSPSKD
ncbi:MAG: DUF2254 domain-containing protein [Nitrobacter sp.]|uniref:DUF2254 domain-containing protein n=1 Tax=Nitrobacter sp. TaxID=29420 RepID=UPI0026140C37|nr:DUF2254 domain-containing protein [Nitrobacter sp.]MCV0387977.1 DUF2254 domain-containing protein [Nitrobacter sp.]